MLPQGDRAGLELDWPGQKIAPLCFSCGVALYSLTSLSEMAKVAEEGLSLLEKKECSVIKANLLNLQARCYEFSDPGRYLSLIFESAGVLDSAENLSGLAIDEVLWIAETCAVRRMRQEEERWYGVARRVAETTGDVGMQSCLSMSLGAYKLFRGDIEGAIELTEKSIQQAIRAGDAWKIAWGKVLHGWCYELRGDFEKSLALSRQAFEAASRLEAHMPNGRVYAAYALRNCATALLGLGRREEALDDLSRVLALYRQFAQEGFPGSRGFLELPILAKELQAAGMRKEGAGVLEQFFGREPHLMLSWESEFCAYWPVLAMALSVKEEAMDDPAGFREFCREYRGRYPHAGDPAFRQWHLELSQPRDFDRNESEGRFDERLLGDWSWVDPLGDCSFETANGLVIRAANCRDLWFLNASAPRLVRSMSGDFSLQVSCENALQDRPGLGGIVIWQDQDTYLYLEHGILGPCDLTFRGCDGARPHVFGRGRLAAGKVWLRVERTGRQVRALCSADGAQWHTLGEVQVPFNEEILAGVFASGHIDRTWYHGAYTEGAAIRFESYAILRPDKVRAPHGTGT